MSIKFVFVLLACIAYQGVSATPMPEASADGILDLIKEALKKLGEIVEQALKDAEAALLETIEELKEAAKQIIAEGIAKIVEAIASIKDQIQQMIEEAIQAGVDVSECIKNADEELNTILVNVPKDLENCVNSSIEKSTNVVKDAIAALKDKARQVVIDLGNNVAACGEAENPLECLRDALKETTQQIAELPQFIADEVAIVKEGLKEASKELVGCLPNTLENAVISGGKVLENARQCIKESLPEKSQ